MPLLPSTAKPVPWPQHGAAACLSNTSTAQLHMGATPGTRRSADYEHRTAGTQQHSANGWLGNASIMQMSVDATPGSRRAAAHQLSTPGTPALLWCTDSNSTLIGKHANT